MAKASMLSARNATPVIADTFVGRSSGAPGQGGRASADRHHVVPQVSWCLRVLPLEAFPQGRYDCFVLVSPVRARGSRARRRPSASFRFNPTRYMSTTAHVLTSTPQAHLTMPFIL